MFQHFVDRPTRANICRHDAAHGAALGLRQEDRVVVDLGLEDAHIDDLAAGQHHEGCVMLVQKDRLAIEIDAAGHSVMDLDRARKLQALPDQTPIQPDRVGPRQHVPDPRGQPVAYSGGFFPEQLRRVYPGQLFAQIMQHFRAAAKAFPLHVIPSERPAIGSSHIHPAPRLASCMAPHGDEKSPSGVAKPRQRIVRSLMIYRRNHGG
ncbi:MAG: hypothetical protein AAF415_10515 [Pseudomonadota bacterium]